MLRGDPELNISCSCKAFTENPVHVIGAHGPEKAFTDQLLFSAVLKVTIQALHRKREIGGNNNYFRVVHIRTSQSYFLFPEERGKKSFPEEVCHQHKFQRKSGIYWNSPEEVLADTWRAFLGKEGKTHSGQGNSLCQAHWLEKSWCFLCVYKRNISRGARPRPGVPG